jgi:hypothetical protein
VCVIIDTNTIPLVFNTKSTGHHRFAPIYSWIHRGDGRIVYGGKKYADELKGMTSFLRLFEDYARQGKVVRANDKLVNSFAAKAKSKEKSKRFNDEHLVGIVAATHCRIICTDDLEAVPFLTRKSFYKAPTKAPKIYSKKTHGHLCCPKSIVSICRN